MSMPLLVMFERTVILHVGAIIRANSYMITMYNLRQHNYTYSLVKHVAAADGLHHCYWTSLGGGGGGAAWGERRTNHSEACDEQRSMKLVTKTFSMRKVVVYRI